MKLTTGEADTTSRGAGIGTAVGTTVTVRVLMCGKNIKRFSVVSFFCRAELFFVERVKKGVFV